MSFKIKGDCSFIEEFLDLTVNLPREIIRLLKLLREVDEKSNKINTFLKEKREKFISSIKTNQNNDDLLQQINEEYSNAISLCDYKKEIIKEVHYLLLKFYMDKLNNVIDQGEKECREQQRNPSNSIQNNFNHSTFPNYYNDKSNDGDYNSITGIQHGNKKKGYNDSSYHNSSTSNSNKLLGNKARRVTKIKNNKKGNNNITNELSETEITQNGKGSETFINEPIYCICKKQRDDIKMICCDNPKCKIQWFHCECMNVSPSDEEKEWFCSEECKKQAKEDRKKKKKNH